MSGHAFSYYGPVARGDLPKVLSYVSKISKIPKHILKLNLLGSAGKVPMSGDIDIALDINAYNVDKIRLAFLSDLSNEGYRAMPGGNFSIAAPNGDNDAQVDFILTENIPWTLFSYFSPGEASKYKGVYRALLLSALTASKQKVVEIDTDGYPLKIIGYVWVPTVGLEYQIKTAKFNKKGRLKSYNIERGEVIGDPAMAIKFLFNGTNIQESDIQSFEQIFDLLFRIFDKEEIHKILKLFQERCVSARIKIPEECTLELSNVLLPIRMNGVE